MKDKYLEYKTLPAYIINKNINNYEKTLVINVGSKNGIKPNMTVIADKGLVGYVISTTDNTSKVQTIIDSSTSVSSIISTSKESNYCYRNIRRKFNIKKLHIYQQKLRY